MKRLMATAAAGVMALAIGGAAQAEQYVRGSLGWAALGDSDNTGAFGVDVTLLPVGAPVTEGQGLGWSTEFDDGLFLSAAYGVALAENVRVEAELSHTNNDVDTHAGVFIDGVGVVDTLDAANLVPGVDEALGVSIGDLVAAGEGSVETLAIAANAYYDFDFVDTPFSAYVGGGIGLAQVDVDYSPSATPIISDDDTVFMFQIMAGGEYAVSENTALYAGYRYRDTADVETEISLFPGTLDVENSANILEFGVRVSF